MLYQVCSSCHDSSKNMAARRQGLFSLYSYIKHFKNLFVRNHWTDFNITWQKCFFGHPLPLVKDVKMFVYLSTFTQKVTKCLSTFPHSPKKSEHGCCSLSFQMQKKVRMLIYCLPIYTHKSQNICLPFHMH